MTEEDQTSIQEPALGRRAFICPHCHAHTQQTWWKLFGAPRGPDQGPPTADVEQIKQAMAANLDNESFQNLGNVLLAKDPQPYQETESQYFRHNFANLHLSRCFVCRKTAIWIADKLIFPTSKYIAVPNEDLPDDVKADFLEAAQIAQMSPRGAAALLRLALEKLCRHLGKTGKIDKMIADLVADGLHIKVQQALDVVRVIGNEAVHPGAIDLRDDQATVQSLFRLLNIIAETMITEQRKVTELFNGLPPEKLAGIEQRNAQALKKAGNDV